MGDIGGTVATIKWFFRCMEPGFVLSGILYFILLWFRKRRLAENKVVSGLLREMGLFLFCVFIGGMAAVTLVPEPSWLLTGVEQGNWYPYFDFDINLLPYRISLIPFSNPDSLFMIAGNVVMFLPFGFFSALLWQGFTWKRALVLGLGITCFIECWQLLVGRTSDIDDIILNTLGVFCGYLLWALLRKFAPEFTKRFHVWKI